MKSFLYFAPRILAILYVLFLGVFAINIFAIKTSAPTYYLFVAFLIHLIPSILVVILLLIAWKYERVGGVLFLLFTIALIFLQNILGIPVVFLIIPTMIGTLFLLDYQYKNIA